MEEEVTLGLKALQPQDAHRLQAWVRAYYAYDHITFDASVESALTELLNNPGFGTAFELVEGEVAIGYAVLTHAFDHEFGGRLGVLTDFILQESSRGKGYGPQYLEMVIQSARMAGLLGLEIPVMKDNTRARALYEKFGFKQSERMDHLFQRF